MKAPISWLKDFVEIDVKPETLAKKLVSIGFEVEEIIYQNKTASKVVVSKILGVEKHPNADKLSVCKVDIGEKTIQIVTNAKMTVGELVPVSLDGAILATGQKINSGELRGVHSDGMFCGGEELGLSDIEYLGASNNDVLRLNGELQIGQNIYDAIGYDDVILDVSITANRPDCNGIFNLAKEVAVVLKKNWKFPNLQFQSNGGNISDEISVEVKNQSLCPRYMAGGVKNVRLAESPKLIQKRLKAVGIRPINNIVDITNYILIELGQPMHAFDKRELSENKIVVRNANDGEEIVSLDGKNNVLNNSMLVICDNQKPVAIAGIMGGENSGIKDDTTEIVFESARFARDSVRRTSKTLNLRSDSSSRFEKGVDFALQEYAIKRAFSLVNQLDAGDVVDGIIDISVPFEKTREIHFDMKKISEILGFTVRKQSLVPILSRLGIEIKEDGKDLVAVVPGDREDMVGVNDIAEEFIRVYGFDHIPTTYFAHEQAMKGGKGERFEYVDKIKDSLASLGLFEMITYSFTSPKCFDKLRFEKDAKERKFVQILNPLGEAVSIMRTTLVHSMLEMISSNISKSNKNGQLFEMAKVYLPKSLPLEELPKEKEMLCIGMFGENVDFFTLKSKLTAFFEKLGFKMELKKNKVCFLHDGRSAEIFVDGISIGVCGEIHPDVMENYDIEQRVQVAEISAEKLFEIGKKHTKFVEISKFPAVQRDLAIVVDEKIPVGNLVEEVLNAKIKFLTKAQVFDVFKSEQIGNDKKSVAMNFEFVSFDKTMTDEQIADSMAKVLRCLSRKFKAKIR